MTSAKKYGEFSITKIIWHLAGRNVIYSQWDKSNMDDIFLPHPVNKFTHAGHDKDYFAASFTSFSLFGSDLEKHAEHAPPPTSKTSSICA